VGFGGFGAFGWMPAGPGDFINPWWGRRRGEFGVVNVTNIYNVRGGVIAPLRGNGFSNVHNMLINNQVRYGMSAVSAENFGHGRAMTRTVSAAELNSGHLMTGNVPVVPSRYEAGTVYVAVDNHRLNDYEPYIWASSDFGATFRSINANLRGENVHTLTEDQKNPDVLYIGTESGIFLTLDRGKSWRRLKTNLPFVRVDEIR
jgi:hypothetical protein